jgi:hypothetical protein
MNSRRLVVWLLAGSGAGTERQAVGCESASRRGRLRCTRWSRRGDTGTADSQRRRHNPPNLRADARAGFEPLHRAPGPCRRQDGPRGLWDYELSYTGQRRRNIDAAAARDPDDPPALFTAVQEQLGLRLETSRGQVEVLVIESAAQPSDN